MGGGFPAGSLILVTGNAGSGKTILTAQYLYHGAKNLGEPGVYASFGESRGVFFENMKKMGMDFEQLEKEGKVRFLELMIAKEEGLGDIFTSIFDETRAIKAKRLVIDSFSVVTQAFTDKLEARILMHTVLSKLPRLGAVTTIIVGERLAGFEPRTIGMEEFVADGIIALNSYPERGYLRRNLQILKMRGSKINTVVHSYDIDDRGIQLYPLPSDIRLLSSTSTEKVSTGIKGLDAMLSGGVYRGSVTLATGESGTGKSTMALFFIAEGLRQGESCLYVTFENAVDEVVAAAASFGLDFASPIKEKTLKVVSFFPEPFNTEAELDNVLKMLQEHNPERVVLDGLSPLERAMPSDRYLSYLSGLMSHLKGNHVSSFFSLVAEPMRQEAYEGVLSLVDNIISLKYVELESSLKRSLTILKAKRTESDKSVTEFDITSKGITVKGKFVGVENILTGSARKSFAEDAARQWAEAFGGKK
jgi:circadian clock protein KaiC